MKVRAFTTALIFFIVGQLIVTGQDLSKKSFDTGITIAYWIEGTATVTGGDVTKGDAVLFRTFFDAYLIPKLAVGFYSNLSPHTVAGGSVTSYEFGASIKPRFLIGKTWAIKPGLNIGYRGTSGENSKYATDGLGLNFSLEVQKALGVIIVHSDFGFLAQPAGGNSATDFTFAPIVYFGFGVAY